MSESARPSQTKPITNSGSDAAVPPTDVTLMPPPESASMPETAAAHTRARPDTAAKQGETQSPGGQATMVADREPVRVAGYKVLGELGRGGMGVVYKARHLKLNRLVALKMILAGGHAGKADLERFRTEAEAVARLQHPNIVQIYEVSEQDGLPYFALEFVDGGSLAARLNGEPLAAKQAARLVEELARAMHYAHGQGIIHRDLKPANILLSFSRETPASADSSVRETINHSRLNAATPKITDFGLAKQLDSESGRTQEGSILGTPSYMAPEQAAGRTSELGPATDVYALGAILYELLTGRPPFRAATPLDTVMQVVHDEPVPPLRLQPTVPRDLETICLKCLEKAPARRYDSAAALAEDLRRFREGEPIAARPAGVLERGIKWARRRPAIAALSAGMLALATAAFALVSWQWLRAEGQKERAETARGDAETQKDRAQKALGVAEEQKGIAETARGVALAQKAAADKARAESDEQRLKLQRLSADLVLDRGLGLCEQGDVGRGLVWLARSLEMAPAEAADFRQLVRRNLAAWRQPLFPLTACLPHSAAVLSVALSPDGETAVTGCADGKAYVWDAVSGKNWLVLPHTGPVKIAAFSPSGCTFLTAEDKKVRLWDAESGKQIGLTMTHNKGVLSAVAFPDDRSVLVGCDEKLSVRWSFVTNKRQGPAYLNDGPARVVAVNGDGTLAVTVRGEKEIRTWHGVKGGTAGRILHVPSPVLAVVFMPTGGALLTGSSDKLVRVWDANARLLVSDAVLPHPGRIVAVTFSADRKTVLTAGNDATVRVWETATGKPLAPPLPHQRIANAAAISADDKTILTGSEDGTARVWSGRPPPTERRTFPHKGTVAAVAFSPDGRTVLTASHDKTACLWDASSGKALAKPMEHKGQVWSAVFSRDGKTVLTGSADGKAQLWNVADGSPAGKPFAHGAEVRAVALSPDGMMAVTAGVDGKVRLWDAATAAARGEFVVPREDGEAVQAVLAVAFSPDGKRLATGGADRTVRVWDVETRQPVGESFNHAATVAALAFGPDGKTLATGCDDKIVRLWDVTSGQQLGISMSHSGEIRSVAFSRRGNLLVAGTADQTAHLWDVATGRSIGPPMRHKGEVLSVAFSPDGKFVLTGGRYGSAWLWDVPAPLGGSVEQVVLESQVVSGLELTAEGVVRVVGFAEWKGIRDRLAELNEGLPSPKRE